MYGQITVAAADKDLTAICGPKEVKAQLSPWDRDTFKFSWPDASDTDELTLAVFTIGPEGKAQSFSLNWDEGAKFKRTEAEPAS